MTVPNPGSAEARTLGCVCPIMDNNHGLRHPYLDEYGQGHYWIVDTCPIHYTTTRSQP